MGDVISVNDELAIAKFEPDVESFKEIAAKGFRSVVNLQPRDEKQKISEELKKRLAEQAGLAYCHAPISSQALNDRAVDRFRDAIEQLPKPVLIHCASGRRAGAAALMYLGVKNKQRGQEILDQAKRMGFECGTQQFDDFVRDYIDRHHADDR